MQTKNALKTATKHCHGNHQQLKIPSVWQSENLCKNNNLTHGNIRVAKLLALS